MGNLDNCYNCNTFERKDPEDKYQTNFLNNFLKQTYNDDFKNFRIVKNSKNELENNLKKIRMKFAIKKILNHFRKYKLKSKIISPIINKNNESFIVNSNYSHYFISSIKKKRISKFNTNNKYIDKLIFNIKDNSKLNYSEIDFNISTSIFAKRNEFNKMLKKL